MEKIISKFQMSISWSKERWRSYICIPSGAQTHMMTHLKREPRGQLRDPLLCRKTILETIKSVSISDYYKFVFLHIPLINSFFCDKRLHRMSFQLLVNNLLSEEDCRALQKNPFGNTCDLHSQTIKARDLKFWDNVHHPGCVMCHMSVVRCHK